MKLKLITKLKTTPQALTNHAKSDLPFSQKKTFLSTLIFLIIFSVFAISPIKTSFDSKFSIYTSLSFAKGDWGELSEFKAQYNKKPHYSVELRENKLRSIYPIGAPIMAIPLVMVFDLLMTNWDKNIHERFPDTEEKIIASVICALSAVIFFWTIFEKFRSYFISLSATFIFAFATSIWSTASRALWQHGPLVLLLSTVMFLLIRAQKRPNLIPLIALPLAFAYLTRPTAIVPILVFSAYVLIYYREYFIKFLLMAMLIAVPWICFNLWIYDWPLPPYYTSNAFSSNINFTEGLFGNLFSPSRGLFIYSPILLLSFSGFLISLKDVRFQALHIAFALIIVGQLIIMGAATMWWAGHSFGPRFATDIIPFMVYFVAYQLSASLPATTKKRKIALACVLALTLISVSIHAQGAFSKKVWKWNTQPTNIDTNPERCWDWSDPQFSRSIRPYPSR